jgi:TRAP-type uncharacterized transport system substrate-binding protein
MQTGCLGERIRRALRHDAWLALAPAVVGAALVAGVTLRWVKPAPPRRLVLAAASDEGGSRYFARRYQEFLAKHGVTLEIRATPGSVSSLALLADAREDVDVALVQGGAGDTRAAPSVVSLGSVTYVPLWIFHRGSPADDLRALAGKRIAIGQPESGTHALALALLEASGVDGPPTELLSLPREEAVARLGQGQLDAVLLVAPAEAPVIHKLAAVPGVRLLSLARAEAFTRRFPYLSRVELPRGVFDLARDVPDADVVLLAPTANLVARDTLHPALAYLLLRAASEIHGSPGLLDRSGEFPAMRETGFPPSSEARRYHASGAPLLQRYLPFWAANLIDRLWVLLVPVIAVVVPLVRAVPGVYAWRVRSRVFRWYARLKEIELQLEEGPGPQRLEEMLRRLDDAERAVNGIQTPLAYAGNLYVFREHIEVVRRRVLRRLAGGTDVPAQRGEAPTRAS